MKFQLSYVNLPFNYPLILMDSISIPFRNFLLEEVQTLFSQSRSNNEKQSKDITESFRTSNDKNTIFLNHHQVNCSVILWLSHQVLYQASQACLKAEILKLKEYLTF